MTFVEHIDELRSRLRNALIAVMITTGIAYLFSQQLFALLAQPLIHAWQLAELGTPKLHFANPIEPFFTYVKVALIVGVFAGSPFIFHQIWSFVAPGLTRKERKYVVPFALFSTLFFVGGAAFGYFMVFPYAFNFMLGFAQENLGSLQGILGANVAIGETFKLQPTLMMGEYFALVWRLLLAFGLVFEMPLLIAFLAMVGLVTHRTLWRWNPYFVVLSFVIGALLTPPDIITQVFMAAPLIVLYNASILLAWLFEKRRERKLDSQML